MIYGDFRGWRWLKNKANSKPIYFVLSTAWCVLRYCFIIPVKTGIHTFGDSGFRIKCGMTILMIGFTECCLKKQSQFAVGWNDVLSAIAMTYDDFRDWRRRKNKANSKPISRACIGDGRVGSVVMIFGKFKKNGYIVSVAEIKNWRCNPCVSSVQNEKAGFPLPREWQILFP